MGRDQGRRVLNYKRAAQRRCQQAHNAGGQQSRGGREQQLPSIELLHRAVEQPRDPAVHIHILQPDQSLLNDSAVMGDKHPESSDGLDEYGIFDKSVPDHNGGHHSDEEGDRCPKSNTEIQGKAIRSSRCDV